jgi:glycosyltransferase involved in cell wall biosynthesis
MKHAVAVLAHPDHAGMLRALRMLAEHGPARGWTVELVVPAPHPLLDTLGLPDRPAVVVPGIGRWRRLDGRLRLPLTVAQLAARARTADLLYAVTLSSFPFCFLAGAVARVPTVVHSYSSYGDPRPYRKLWLQRARNVIAPSQDSLALAGQAIGGFGPGVRARVVRNGMEAARLTADAAAALPIPLPAGPRIGLVGNLDWRKNPAALVEAAAVIRRQVPEVQVLLIGAFRDAAYEADVRGRIAQHGLADCVHVTGFLANPFPVVSRLDVLVHPAVRDPFPLALLEGMALGRPIVATAVGGIPEMFVDGESGVLVPPGDIEALAAAVTDLLLNEPRRHAIGQAAASRLAQFYTPQRFAAALCTAFDEAVAGHGR